jgi:hypothetical protein
MNQYEIRPPEFCLAARGDEMPLTANTVVPKFFRAPAILLFTGSSKKQLSKN